MVHLISFISLSEFQLLKKNSVKLISFILEMYVHYNLKNFMRKSQTLQNYMRKSNTKKLHEKKRNNNST
jgi:hypothetical protein